MRKSTKKYNFMFLGRILGRVSEWDQVSDTALYLYDFVPVDLLVEKFPSHIVGVEIEYQAGLFRGFNAKAQNTGIHTWELDLVDLIKILPIAREA